jgi:hypothetical protein
MKALFIACSQAYNEEVIKILELFGQRGFTRWTGVSGRGTTDGLPHMGDHAWPDQNHAVLSFVDDDTVADRILEALHRLDSRSPELGLRAFMWNIENNC